jgi:FkbM family methyltransferase
MDSLNSQKVFAIEAIPEAADEIKKTYPDFTVWCTGVSNFNGTSKFQKVISNNKEFRGSSSIESRIVESRYQFQLIDIPITTMKDLLESNFMKNDILDLVKIDCEGFSYQVLEGFGDMLKNIRVIHVETEQRPTHPNHMNTQKVIELMTRNNFSLVEISSEWSDGIIDQVWVNHELAVYQKEMLKTQEFQV